MKVALLIVVAALSLAACGPQAGKPGDEPKSGALMTPRIGGKLYSCDLTYFAQHGPLAVESHALVKMGLDPAPGTGGWRVDSVAVTTPLPEANGFDPWLPLMSGPQFPFVARNGSVLTLAVASGAPITFDTLSGALDWHVTGALGDSGYRGGCF